MDDFLSDLLKDRFPSLEDAERTRDQSHFWHEWVASTFFAAWGVAFAWIFHGWTAVAAGWAFGCGMGVLAYVYRETFRKWLPFLPGTPDETEVERWDTLCDLMLPLRWLPACALVLIAWAWAPAEATALATAGLMLVNVSTGLLKGPVRPPGTLEPYWTTPPRRKEPEPFPW